MNFRVEPSGLYVSTRSLICSVLLLMAAAALGYRMRGWPRDGVILPSEVPRLHAYVARQSFSEVRNARAALEELGARYVMAIETRRLMDCSQSAGNGRLASSSSEPHIPLAVEELELGMRDFRGTGQEFTVARELLRALKNSRRLDRWLEVYLDMLYQHPTQPLVGSLAGNAVVAAKAAGREDALAAGFRHLTMIPLDFEAKGEVQRALASFQGPDEEPGAARQGERSSRAP